MEDITLNEKLMKEGFVPRACIVNNELPERLTPIMIELSRGKYDDVRVVPGDVAFKGCKWELENASHVIYVKENEMHPDYCSESFRAVRAGFLNKETGEKESQLVEYVGAPYRCSL